MTVRIGVAGTGNIGMQHIELLKSGQIRAAELAATLSTRSGRVAEGVPHFQRFQDMLDSANIDAVLVATPTMTHPELGEATLRSGLHLLMEKPIAMSVSQAQGLIAQAPEDLTFALMLNQRYHAAYSKLKSLLDAGVLGELHRFNWTMTAWYRPDIYYQASNWRGTWHGEGGGLLINQCIHNLDILDWLFGMPNSLAAHIGLGSYHDIEVEDDVAAIMKFDSGMTGVLVASSGEAPGVNRLEIVGDRGMLVYDDQEIKLLRTDQPVSEHCRDTQEMFGVPAVSEELIALDAEVNQHAAVIENFVAAIQGREALATPAEEGLGSLQLANGMLLSSWTGGGVELPLDSNAYESRLQQRVALSGPRQPRQVEVQIDMSKSYR